MTRRSAGSLVLLGGGEWQDGGTTLDAQLLSDSKASEVVVLPTAAAYEHPERVAGRAETYFGALGASVRTLDVVHRRDAEDADMAAVVRKAKFVYVADGSPLHLRSVLKGSAVFEAMLASYRAGGVLAASGAGATLLCDPMVDPRGGAYTVGLGVIENLAVFPYHGTAAAHLRERSIDLLPASAVLAGIDEQTALVLRDNSWTVAGPGVVTVYTDGMTTNYRVGETVPGLPVG